MIKLVVGLGNPGEQYDGTRHNVGRLLLNAFPKSTEIICAENDGFMNESGVFVKRLVDRHTIGLEELCVIHDDITFGVGEYRLQKGKNSNGHRGVENIIYLLGSNNFWRVRVGVGEVPLGVDQSEYVLGQLSKSDEKAILALVPSVWDKITAI